MISFPTISFSRIFGTVGSLFLFLMAGFTVSLILAEYVFDVFSGRGFGTKPLDTIMSFGFISVGLVSMGYAIAFIINAFRNRRFTESRVLVLLGAYWIIMIALSTVPSLQIS